uniref:G domain-containing protein n=1 Tax=Glossina pallidipes TaxID=7398 RepID=A0A1A9ZHG5_GLOPL
MKKAKPITKLSLYENKLKKKIFDVTGSSFVISILISYNKAMQEVALDSKITLIDWPGIVFTNNLKSENVPALLNAQRVGDVKDPFTAAESILKPPSKEFFYKLYDITEHENLKEWGT